jgi:hypothetical protein
VNGLRSRSYTSLDIIPTINNSSSSTIVKNTDREVGCPVRVQTADGIKMLAQVLLNAWIMLRYNKVKWI